MTSIKVYNMSRGSFFWFRIIPGAIALTLVTSPVWMSVLGIQDIILFYLAFVATYVLYKSAQNAVTDVIGFKRMQVDVARDWAGELHGLRLSTVPDPQQLPTKLTALYHLVFIPIYKEPYDILDKTFSALAHQDYPFMKNVIIVAAVEERAGEAQKKIIKSLKNKYSTYFYDIWEIYHPFGLPGEVIGDACANLRWAAVAAAGRLGDIHIPIEHVVFTKFDSDTRLHPKHFSALTYLYLTSPQRMNRYFGPGILIYSNNYWRVPAITRVFFATLTLGVINEWVAEKSRKQTFSCYSGNFLRFEKANFWDPGTGAEDTYYYWNMYLHLDGNFSGEPFFLPTTMDAVEGKTLWGALKPLYNQQLRWGWGVLIMPIALQGMSWNTKIGIMKKLGKFSILFRAYNFMLTAGFLLTVTIPIITLLNNNIEYSSISYNLPRSISVILTMSMIFQIPSKYYTWKFYGSPPKTKSVFFHIWWWIFEPFLMFVNIWTYYLIPRVQAIYELTVGKHRKKFLISIEGRLDETTEFPAKQEISAK